MRFLALATILACATVCHAATGMFGDWKTNNGSIVRLTPCGSDVCLKVVQLSPSVPETTDRHNPDASLRNRPLCGLTIGTGFHKDDATHLSGGHIYDPESGSTYKGNIALDGDRLKLHGYIGISLFGRTETWTRAPGTPVCAAA